MGTLRPLERRPQHPGRTAIEAWRRDALAIERAAAGKEADEDQGATNRRCWRWIALALVLIGGGLLLWQLGRQCWDWTTTIGC
jgi:ferric-dicitrate binding protein FerR (iron transport regulator)